MENKTFIAQLKSESTWKLFFLSVITLGIYTAHYIHRQSRILNDHLAEGDKLSKGFTGFFLIYSYLTVLILIPYLLVEEGHPIQLASDVGDRIWNLLVLILAFKFRNRMNRLQSAAPGHEHWFSGVATFFFCFLYINFKINKLSEMIPNGQLEPVVQTPAEEIQAQGAQAQPQRSGKEIMKKTLMIIGVALLALILALIISLMVIGSMGPDTSVYPGPQIPSKFMTTIRSLNLLQEDEKIRYFYSDALIDIRKGFYFVTDQNLVLYSSEWEPPEIIIPLDTITAIDPVYDDSFFMDTFVLVSTSSGDDFSFPVSSEQGLDRKFIDAIKQH